MSSPQSGSAKAERAGKEPPHTPASEGPKQPQTADAGPVLVKGMIEAVALKDKRVDIKLITGNGSQVTSTWMSSWDKAHHQFLVKGAACELFVVAREKNGKSFINVVGLKRVGSTEFDESGKVPILRTDRPAGSRTLF